VRRLSSGIPFPNERTLPDTNKLDIDVYRECTLEGIGLLPASAIGSGVHFIGERDLLEIVGWKQTHLMQREHVRDVKISVG